MRYSSPLFNHIDWYSFEKDLRSKLVKEIDTIDGDKLLNSSVDDLCNYYETRFQIDVPFLKPQEIVADQRESKIDTRRSMHSIHGTTIEISVPFDGDSEMFKVRPSSYTFNPPRAEIKNNNVIIEIEGVNLTAEQVKADVNRVLTDIESYLVTQRSDAKNFNGQLRSIIKSSIEGRKEKLLGDRNLLGSLGFKMKVRDNEVRTFAAPDVRRKSIPFPALSSAPFKPEPTLDTKDYDHILSVIQNMVHVMERSPSAFKSMDEETIRSHFLVQLNGHYDGQATGETFNYQGKTDILIRSEGKNIFIGECKFWSGPKMLIGTIDQLLDYSSWRDTKVAVIIFNRNKDFTKVLESIQDTSKTHKNFKRELNLQSETIFRYVFSHKDDKNRELFLTVMAFDVPS